MESRIKVAVRCRPPSREESRGRRAVVAQEDVVQVGDKKFHFEHVFAEQSTQEEIYERCIRSLVEGCFQGYNATVFAYGQTGSGKTYSVIGSTSDDQEEGIIPRAIRQIFTQLKALATGHLVNVRVSMVELYNDECKDLLHPEILSRDIVIREDKLGRIFFTGAREEAVTSTQAALSFLEIGLLNRSTAETLMNQNSSRSHAIFTVSLEILEYTVGRTEEERSLVQAKLHLVDLAGSERAKKTGASGTRLKESVGINQGLLSLGKVIRALTTVPVSAHIPYRESKLTRFLQDSLGGNSRTLLLACISVAEANAHETISTLQYAQRAKAVQNKVTANVTTDLQGLDLPAELESNVVLSLRAEITQMQERLSALQGGDEQRVSHLERRLQRLLYVLKVVRANLQTLLVESAQQQDAARLCKATLQLLNEALQTQQTEDGKGSQLRNSTSLANLPPAVELSTAEEVMALRQELAECREDLRRDEVIFAEKMKELKQAKKQVKELETKNALLSEHQTVLRKQISRLVRGPLPDAALKQSIDMDISLAVAAAEPDISQLMEDIEALVQEKEKAAADHLLVAQQLRHLQDAQTSLMKELQQAQEKELEQRHCIDALRTEVELLRKHLSSKQQQDSQQAAEEAMERYRSILQQYEQKEDVMLEQIKDAQRELRRSVEEEGRLKVRVEELSDQLRSVSSSSLPSQCVHALHQRLTGKVEELAALGVVQVEISRLQKGLDVMCADRNAVLETLHGLKSQQKQHQQREQVRNKILQIDDKLKLLRQRAKDIRSLSSAERSSELQEVVDSIESYEEHRAELADRLHRLGAMNGDGKLEQEQGELEEELDSLNTEIEFTETRLKQQQEFFVKCVNLHTDAAQLRQQEENWLSIPAQARAVCDDLKDFVQRSLRLPAAALLSFDFLCLCVELAIEQRIQCGASEAMVRQMQQQLEDKCGEYDGLIKTMQRMRSEHMKKQEQARKEADDKISFLVQQLKHLEQRHEQTSLSSPHRRSGTFSRATSRPTSATHALPPPPSHAISSSVVALLQQSHQRTLDSLRKEYHDLPANAEKLLNEDVLRRYGAEKERREQLERRNTELAKELRSLRSALENH